MFHLNKLSRRQEVIHCAQLWSIVAIRKLVMDAETAYRHIWEPIWKLEAFKDWEPQ